MKLYTFAICLLAALLPILPGSSTQSAQAKNRYVIKVATIVPRSGSSARYAKKAIRRLEKRTDERVTARVYWGGAAGEEDAVLKKMRVGQIDAAYMGLDMIRNFVPQVMVMAAPQTYTAYKQVDAVREVFTPEFNQIAYRNGFVISSWGDAGVLRIFSTTPVKSLKDFRAMRPWVYKHSPLLKEFYRMIGCAGVPIGLTEVYSALKVGLIDLVWGSALITSLLQWHAKIQYVSEPTGLVQGGAVITRRFWDRLDKRDQEAILKMVEEERKEIQEEVREVDGKMYRKLLKRGIKAYEFTNIEKWRAAGKRLREKMVGRLYSREMLTRVEKIIAKYPDRPGTPDSFR